MIALSSNAMINLALATILFPFAGAAVIALSTERMARKLAQLFAAATVALMLAVGIFFVLAKRVAATHSLITFGSIDVLGLTVDNISVLIGFAVIVVGFLVAVYSGVYLGAGNREHPDNGRQHFYAFLMTFIGAMAGLVFSSTITGQLAFFEIAGACSWALIGYYETPKDLRSAAKTLVITHTASLGLLVTAALLLIDTGTFSLSALSQLSPEHKTVALLAVLVAAWGKSAQLPLHVWLPDAHTAAPSPASALMSGVMVKIGVYVYARALMAAHGAPDIVGWVGVVMAIATLIYGFLMYLPQVDMKRLLAYSTITQLSYIFFGLSLSVFGSEMAFKGAIMHIFNHAFAKTLFFLVAGGLGYAAGTRLLPSLRGIFTSTPLLGVGFVTAALAIAGVPPFSGFFSKFAIFWGGFQASQLHLLLLPLVIIAMAESVGCFAWFLKWVGHSVPGRPSAAMAAAAPVPKAMRQVLVVLMIMAVCSSFIAASWLG